MTISKVVFMKTYYVYILASIKKKLYIGVTSDLLKRIYQHKTKETQGFTEKYNIDQLVYYEEHQDVKQAILREKQIKKWKRDWKLNLINEKNCLWDDLYYQLIRD